MWATRHRFIPIKNKMLCFITFSLALVAPRLLGQESSPQTAISSLGAGAPYVPTLTFDVVSIRETKSTSGLHMVGGSNSPHSSRLSLASVMVYNLILDAYHVDITQISGAPDWMGSTLFDVLAKGDESTEDK